MTLEGLLYPSRYVLVFQILQNLPPIKSLGAELSLHSPLLSIFYNSILTEVSNFCSKSISDKFKIKLAIKILKDRSLVQDDEMLYDLLTCGPKKEQVEEIEDIITEELIEYCKDENFTPFLPFWQNDKTQFSKYRYLWSKYL